MWAFRETGVSGEHGLMTKIIPQYQTLMAKKHTPWLSQCGPNVYLGGLQKQQIGLGQQLRARAAQPMLSTGNRRNRR
jgi:hypothetical protein